MKQQYVFLVLLLSIFSLQVHANTFGTTANTTASFALSIVPTFNSFGPYCQGDSVPVLPSVSNNGISGNWSPSSINTNLLGVSTYTFTPNIGQDALSASIAITINSVPYPPISIGNITECASSPLQTLNANNFITPIPGQLVSWHDAATIGNLIANPTLNTIGTVTYYAESNNGTCSSSTRTAVTLTILPASNAGILTGVQNICVGLTTSFTSTATGGVWSSSNTAIATVNPTTGVVTGIAAGTATLTYTVLGTGGCPNATALRVITVSAPASPGTLAGNQNICVGESTTFTSTTIGGAWSSANPTVATINSATGVINGISAGIATITYTVIGVGGCSNATAVRTVTVNSCTSLTLTSDASTLNQSILPNSQSITPIVFNVSNGATDVQVTGLPPGVSGQLNQGVFRITGTPTICGTFNWTATTVGGTGSASVSGTITVASISTALFCDSNNLSPNSVGFDWAPVVGATDYNVSYSIDGGPTQTANVVASNYQVSGVQSGQSVLFTVASASGTPCFGPVSTTCTLLANSDFDADELLVYPNPVHDILYIRDLKFISDVSLFNAIGQQVGALNNVSNNCAFDMSLLADGLYFVKITTQEQIKTTKVIKN